MAISHKQRQILAFPYTKYDALIADGAIRSGKTTFMIVAFIDDAMRRYNNQRFGICGKTVDSTVKNIIMPYLGMTLPQEKYSIQWRRSDKLLIISDGVSENYFEIFGGKDESSFALIQGRTLAGVLFDEVALQPRSFVEQALARCSVAGSKLWFNCNPGPPSHWFYTDWILQPERHNAVHLHFELEDNPALDQKIIERYKSMYSGVFYDRYIRGLWVVAEGLVYPMFGKDHVVSDHGTEGVYYVSMDYGTINPTAMGLWRIHNGVATMEKEYYHSGREGSQKTDEEYYQDLKTFIGNVPIQRIIIDPSAASMKACIRKHGEFKTQDADNSVIDGIRFTSTLIKSGKLKIHESCQNTQKEFGLYRWDEKSEKDAVIKENDHSMDQMRYLCYTLRNKYFREQRTVTMYGIPLMTG